MSMQAQICRSGRTRPGQQGQLKAIGVITVRDQPIAWTWPEPKTCAMNVPKKNRQTSPNDKAEKGTHPGKHVGDG